MRRHCWLLLLFACTRQPELLNARFSVTAEDTGEPIPNARVCWLKKNGDLFAWDYLENDGRLYLREKPPPYLGSKVVVIAEGYVPYFLEMKVDHHYSIVLKRGTRVRVRIDPEFPVPELPRAFGLRVVRSGIPPGVLLESAGIEAVGDSVRFERLAEDLRRSDLDKYGTLWSSWPEWDLWLPETGEYKVLWLLWDRGEIREAYAAKPGTFILERDGQTLLLGLGRKLPGQD